MESLLKVLMERDGLSKDEALQQIEEAREEVLEGADPEEVLADWFGLEPDYVFDLLG
jgi:predicted RNase H-like HicB family nuclease